MNEGFSPVQRHAHASESVQGSRAEKIDQADINDRRSVRRARHIVAVRPVTVRRYGPVSLSVGSVALHCCADSLTSGDAVRVLATCQRQNGDDQQSFHSASSVSGIEAQTPISVTEKHAARAYTAASTLPPAYCASASFSTAQPGSSHVYGLAGNSGGAANPGPAAFGGV